MKDYKEMADSVYEAVRKEKFKRAKRAGFIRKAIPCCCICCGIFAAVIAAGSIGRNVDLNPENYQVPNAQPAEETSGEASTELQGFNTEPNEASPDESGVTEGAAPSEISAAESTTPDEALTGGDTLTQAESIGEYEQIGWIKDADGSTYPAMVEKESNQKADDDLISAGITPMDTEKILSALNNNDYYTTGIKDADENGVKIVSWQKGYADVYVQCGYGEEIYALEGGEVIEAGFLDGRGFSVTVMNWDVHEVITYNHLSEVKVSVGDEVSADQVIGLAGNSGAATHTGTVYVKASDPKRILK
ncbi:MAG: M23 family metallopeptidase [Firmicutes bacterium]|nr:M23 family metallopeptidase [[Eubacterium] siraeum]MCM1488444.1 M23 family metallopeptidase [Bacillota bacterium]